MQAAKYHCHDMVAAIIVTISDSMVNIDILLNVMCDDPIIVMKSYSKVNLVRDSG